MKTRFVFACTAAGIALTAFGAGTANADNLDRYLQISPDVARAGDSVKLLAACDAATYGGAESWAFADVSEFDGNQDAAGVWHLAATATIRDDVEPGAHTALFTCGDETFTGAFTVEKAAEPYAAIGIDDDEIKPGQEVRVAANCQDPKFVSSPVTSPVLTAPDLVREKGEPVNSPMFSMGKIHDNAKPGTYPISFTCVDREITDEFTVTGEDPVTPVKKKAQVPVKPKGAADTGSLDRPATKTAAPESGDDTGLYVLGGSALAALGAAGGVGAWAYRRRQRA